MQSFVTVVPHPSAAVETTEKTMISQRHSSFRYRFVLVIVLFVGTAMTFWGQTLGVSSENGGAQLGNAYSVGEFDTVNTTNGNLMFNFPLAKLPPGRGAASAGINLVYSSKLYQMRTVRVKDERYPCTFGEEDNSPEICTYYYKTIVEPSAKGGWRFTSGWTVEPERREDIYQGEMPSCRGFLGIPTWTWNEQTYIHKMRVVGPDGSEHEMLPRGYSESSELLDKYYKVTHDGYIENCGNGRSRTGHAMSYYSEDGSFLRLDFSYDSDTNPNNNTWTLYFPDGSKVTGGGSSPNRNYDRNSNYVEGLTDSFGRTIISGVDSNGNQTITTDGVAGEDITWTVAWKTIYVNKTYQSCADMNVCPSTEMRSTLYETWPVVDTITEPQQMGGRTYTFSYNGHSSHNTSQLSYGWGEVSGVELPGGAVMAYEYAMDGLDGPDNGFEDDVKVILQNYPNTKAVTHDGVTDTWGYYSSDHQGGSSTPDDGQTLHYYTNRNDQGWQAGLTYKTVINDVTKIEKKWDRGISACGFFHTCNPYVKTEFTSIKNASGIYESTAIKDFIYDQNGNVTEVKEYDFVPYALVPRTGDTPTGLPSNANDYLVRITRTAYFNPTPAAGTGGSVDPDRYDQSTSKRLLGLAQRITVLDKTQVVKSVSELTYDYTNYDSSNTKAGNVTLTRVWDSTKGSLTSPLTDGNSVKSQAAYNGYGMPTSTTDANNVTIQITYGNVSGPSGTVTDLYPTQTVAAYGTSLARTSTAVYDFYTGLITSATDEDNDLTNSVEYDDLGRPVKVRNAAGTALESWVRTTYDDVNRRVIAKADLETIGDGKKVAIQHFDQLGRVRLSRTLENAAVEDPANEQHGIKVETRYLTETGYTYQLTSNPYRTTADPTFGWTRSKAWSTGRRSEIETFSGSSLPAPWGSNSTSTGVVVTEIDTNTTTVTDQAGKKRRTVNNAIGHLIRVDEPNDAGDLDSGGNPVQPTSYAYDTLNNLTTVTQGSQTRTFVYSSFSRMISETNPEAGMTTYEFDNNGNPTEKTDARGVSTNFVYDPLNRVTQKSYSGESGYTTPTVTYTYDEFANAKGRLTKVSSSISENRYLAFDKKGRVLESRQTTDGENYNFEYVYNLAGQLVEQTYPSGRTVKNVFATDGDLSMIKSKKTANHGYLDYAKHFAYNPSGAVTSVQLGNGQWQSSQFNPKLQMVQTSLGTTPSATNLLKLEFNYGTTANTGILQSQTITVPTVGQDQGFIATQSYTYDSLNRLKSATETIASSQTWKQAFVFDRFGNRNFDEEETSTLTKGCMDGSNPVMCAADRKRFNPSVNQNNNRLNTSEDYSYDSGGNTTGDPDGRIFKYDGENKQYEVRNSSNGIIGQYYFDGGGKRIKKVVPSTGETTVFVYDANGKLSAEYSTELSQSPQTSYITSDHLGSPRIKTDQLGAVVARNDYHPYGEEVFTQQRSQGLGYKPDDVRQKFTGYERDNEIGLDFAQARMYASQLGRFTTTDPSRRSVQTILPQTWNRYVYCHNNPIAYTDPNGKWPPGMHDTILQTALNRMARLEPQLMKSVEKGSRKVDRDGLNVKTMYEKNAHEHAMTPGKRVKEIGLEKAKEEAKGNAIKFIEGNLKQAQKWFDNMKTAPDQWKYGAVQASLDKFGAAMHPVMDNVSPAHAGFQVYDNVSTAQIGASVGYATGGIPGAVIGAGGSVVGSLLDHKNTESRPPTEDEMNLMVDEIRYHFRQTYGQEAYESAVSEDERKKTDERLAKRGTEGMLVR